MIQSIINLIDMIQLKRQPQDVSSLFKTIGLTSKIVITTTANTYEVDPNSPEDNWLYPAFVGFKKLKQKLIEENKDTACFVTIGSGQGLDAIGAHHLLQPTKIVLTDVHPAVIPIAKHNYLKNIKNKTDLEAYDGNLCEPLRQHNIIADIIYANLPNIPFDGPDPPLTGQLSSTFFSQQWVKPCSLILKRYLLNLQNTFLSEAYASLTPGGSVVLNLGGRVPLWLIKKMFKDNGFQYEELFNMLKVQSQPEWVLGGYARAEEKYRVTFDFYRLDAAFNNYGEKLTNKNLSASKFKKMLRPYRISATAGLKLLVYKHERIGHLVQIIRGLKK